MHNPRITQFLFANFMNVKSQPIIFPAFVEIFQGIGIAYQVNLDRTSARWLVSQLWKTRVEVVH